MFWKFLSPEWFQPGNLGGCRIGIEVALVLVPCHRLPVFTHIAPTSAAGGSNGLVLQLQSMQILLSHNSWSRCGSVFHCTTVVQQQSSPLSSLLLLQIPTPDLVLGLCEPKEKALPVAEGSQLLRKDLASLLPNPLARSTFTGSHHAALCYCPPGIHSHAVWGKPCNAWFGGQLVMKRMLGHTEKQTTLWAVSWK